MKQYLVTILYIILTPFWSFSQHSAGIKFKNHEVNLEERTSLVLLETAKVNAGDRMVLSTDILFNKSPKHYFGYILRMIDSNHRNIDIVFNFNNGVNYNFSLIYDHEITPIQFNLKDQQKQLNKWMKLVLEVDVNKNTITLSVGDQSKTAQFQEIKKFTNLKYYFGANNNPYFKVHDVAPVTIRNIQLQLDDTKLEWPLNEKEGTKVHCRQGEKYNGVVNNGIWLSELQSKWTKVEEREIDGMFFYFNETHSYYYFLKGDSLFKKYLHQKSPKFITKVEHSYLHHTKTKLLEKKNGDLIFYNQATDDLHLLDIKTKQMTKGDISFPMKRSNTKHASWINNEESAIVFFGGYGNFEYTNHLAVISLNNLSYEPLQFLGDTISPRYFPGVGKAKKGHQYIFGGYGSKSGKQIAHPENYYDLYDFDERTNTSKKIATWERTDESFIVSKNIVVDTVNNQFLALTYDNHVHKNQLKLKLFDINTQTSKDIANAIPFSFHDLKSTIEFKYDVDYQKLYAIILNEEGETSKLQLFTLDVTGGTFKNLVNEEVLTAHNNENNPLFYIVIGVLFLLVIFIIWKYFIGKGKKLQNQVPHETPVIKPTEDKKQVNQALTAKDEVVTKKVIAKEHKVKTEEETITLVGAETGVVNFFGGFRIIDIEGNDISNKFTPLIKQIFLMISLSQFLNGRGVTIEQLTEVFWNDMPLKKARNNRSVNIAKLKQLFKLVGNINLVKTGDFWKIEYDDTVSFPLFELKELLDRESTFDNLQKMTKILKNGKLLYGTDYPWMEEIMAQIVNSLIEKLYSYLTNSDLSLSPKEKLRVSDLILKYDALNEEAIHIKCQIYTSQGMHSMAKDTFGKFVQEYELLYNERFDYEYAEFIKSDY
ncbi:hypothetical protein [Flammeovirga aprica]|uniref:Galactose oxidase n=1 Tax=Flammeovirga aprica JL-4 TaxID=694437 RepID=A0A7X9RXX5_9BACT|nr:hypothetical protein [Flammeovirga aprica]NME70629.1 hypothetical protein [Flammeovirga aprica JL-4]